MFVSAPVLTVITVGYSGIHCEKGMTTPTPGMTTPTPGVTTPTPGMTTPTPGVTTPTPGEHTFCLAGWRMGVVCYMIGAKLFRKINYNLSSQRPRLKLHKYP